MAKRGQTIRKPPTARKRSSAGRRAPAPKRTKADVDTNTEVVTLKHELAEAREQQAATSELLKVIGRSTFDLQSVFETLAENAGRLCEAKRSFIFRFDGQYLRVVATHNVSAEIKAFVEQNPIAPGRASATARAALEQRTVHVLDAQTDPEYTYGSRLVEPFRTILTVPMLKAGELLGVILVYRLEMRPFTDSQIALLETFADQAVIAIENSRLFNETKEALERQTATAELLQVINSSPGDLAPVFDAILEKAHRLCGVAQGSLQLYDGSKFRALAVRGLSEAFANRLRVGVSLNPNAPGPHLLKGARFVQIPDLGEIDDPMSRAAFELAGIRTVLFIPLRKDGTLLGRISASRSEVKLFTEKEIGLLESFAAQAVIAMENARLLGELRQRTSDLTESLQQQTATADVLKVISRSTFDLDAVLATLVQSARDLCDAPMGVIFLRPGDVYRISKQLGYPPEYEQYLVDNQVRANRGRGAGRAALTGQVAHIPDVLADPEYSLDELQRHGRYRVGLSVPLF